MPALENARREKFVHNIIKGMAQDKAYEAAGYNATGRVAATAAARLMREPIMKARYAELMAPKVKEITDIRDLARQYTAEATETQVEIMRDPTINPAVRLAASLALHDRGHGKSAQHIEVEISVYESLPLADKQALLEVIEALDDDEEGDQGGLATTH